MNHMLLMDDLKLIAKSKNQIDFRLQTVRIFSEDIVMQFGIKKYGILLMGRGKATRTDGQNMKSIDEACHSYFGISETDKIKEKEMKERFSKEYLGQLRLI